MKSVMTKIWGLCVFTLAAFMFICPTSVRADETTNSKLVEEYGEPIEVNSYIDEDGNEITESIYFKPDLNVCGKARSSSGAGWFVNEKKFTWDNGKKTVYNVAGYFMWDDDFVDIGEISYGYGYLPDGATVTDENIDAGTGRYAYIFNKYAYVTYSFTLTTPIGIKHDLSVTLRVSESGNTI